MNCFFAPQDRWTYDFDFAHEGSDGIDVGSDNNECC